MFEGRQPRWVERLNRMRPAISEVAFPQAGKADAGAPSQDAEVAHVVIDGREREVRLHDYAEIYRVPGLYETLIYETLECRSPGRVVGLLEEILEDRGVPIEDLRVLDVGAGNGVVGDELDAAGVGYLAGLDIIPAAREAALRDRPGIYDAYLVADLVDLAEAQEKRLRQMGLNALVLVGALGFGDMPAPAFTKAIDLIASRGWLAFNLEEGYLESEERGPFADLIERLTREGVIRYEACRRYRHRLSVTGRPIYYIAVVARKLCDLPDDVMEAWALATADPEADDNPTETNA